LENQQQFLVTKSYADDYEKTSWIKHEYSAVLQGCSGVGKRGNGVPTPFSWLH